jgi:hypothetical protein
VCFRLACIQDICVDLQQHYISVSATLEKCVQTKGDIVCYYAHIRQQLREGDELYKVQNIQLRNKAECCRQQGLLAFSLCEYLSLYFINNQFCTHITQTKLMKMFWTKCLQSVVHL